MNLEDSSADTVIIGAGAAGLTAARELSLAGQKLIILEARDRIGGRILTHHDLLSSIPIELGAEFIHGEPKETWDIVNNSHLPVYQSADNHWTFQNDRLEQRSFWSEIEKITEQMKKFDGQDISLKDFLTRCCQGKEWEEKKSLALAYFEGFDAVLPEKAGIRALLKADESSAEINMDKSFRMVTGYDGLIERLWSGVSSNNAKLYTSTIAKKVLWKRDQVEIQAHRQSDSQILSIKAKRLLITVPLGVLKASRENVAAINFEPALAEKEEALSKIEMGHVVKIILRFRERFWEDLEICYD